MRSTALDLGAAGPDTVYGWGQINALAASGLDEVPPEEDRLLAPFPNPARDGVVHFPVQLAERGLVELNVFARSWSVGVHRALDLWPGSHDRRVAPRAGRRAGPWPTGSTSINCGRLIAAIWAKLPLCAPLEEAMVIKANERKKQLNKRLRVLNRLVLGGVTLFVPIYIG